MRFIKVFSHVRSGTHFLMEALRINFYQGADLSGPANFVGHWTTSRSEWLRRPSGTKPMPMKKLFGGHPRAPRSDGIYIFRDGRDVLASMYLVDGFHNQDRPRPGFSEWIRSPLDWIQCPSNRAPEAGRFTPIEHWYRLVKPWLEMRGTSYLVRYEHLTIDYWTALDELAEAFKLGKPDRYRKPELCGHFPRLGVPASWRELFSPGDLEYFFSIVPHDFPALWTRDLADDPASWSGEAARELARARLSTPKPGRGPG